MLALLQGREIVFTAFKSEIFSKSKESQEGKGLKISTSNQMLKRLPIALAQIKAGNNSESLLIHYIDQKKLLKKYTKT